MIVKRGEVYFADLDPSVGSEQGGFRPVVIIQNDIGNTFSTTTIAALTTNTRHSRMPTHVSINGNNEPLRDSVATLEQLRTIDKSRLKSYARMLSDKTMKKICSSRSKRNRNYTARCSGAATAANMTITSASISSENL